MQAMSIAKIVKIKMMHQVFYLNCLWFIAALLAIKNLQVDKNKLQSKTFVSPLLRYISPYITFSRIVPIKFPFARSVKLKIYNTRFNFLYCAHIYPMRASSSVEWSISRENAKRNRVNFERKRFDGIVGAVRKLGDSGSLISAYRWNVISKKTF